MKLRAGKELDKYIALSRSKNIVGNMIVFTVANLIVGSLEALAPEVLKRLKRHGLDAKALANVRYYIKKAAGRMIDAGFIEVKTTAKDKKFFALTDKGRELLLRYRLGELKINKPHRWDGNWRVIVFDISEQKRHVRDLLRRELTGLGLRQLQKSVWVSPYDCEEIVLLLKTGFGMGKEVLYMEVAYLENDRWLRKEFGLD